MATNRKRLSKQTLAPRPFQANAINLALEAIDTYPDMWHLFCSPTGTGKSIMELSILSRIDDSILITPRIEIIAGMLQKLGYATDDMSVLEIVNTGSQYGLYTPIRLRNLLAKGLLPFQPALIILDECFPAGTQVNTPYGSMSIEHIKVGDTVTSFDEKIGTIVERKVTRLFKNPAPDVLVTLTIGSRVITCTEGHPIYTQAGWKNAHEITADDCVLLSLPKSNGTQSVSTREGETGEAKFLFSEMLQHTSEAYTVGSGITDEPQVCIGQNEATQSLTQSRSPDASIPNVESYGPQTHGEGWERIGFNGMRENASCGDRARAAYLDNGERLSTPSLQTRFSRPNDSAMCGSGRGKPRDGREEGTGREKGYVLNWQRVDSVTIHQSTSIGEFGSPCPDGYVYNIEVEGTHTYLVNDTVVHNCHHSLAESWQDIQMYLNGIPVIGFTATPYRGTPKGTEAFRGQWGTINQCITLQEAIRLGYCSLPTPSVWPLIDDDTIDIVNGEIKVAAANSLLKSNFHHIVSRSTPFYDAKQKLWDRPTMYAVPSTEAAKALTEALNTAGLRAVCITQETSRGERSTSFQRVVNCTAALVQIDVVSEGVDLPIRRLIDAKPTLSPVKWLQQVGRITRPTVDEPPAEYICLCRNLERHCYLMEGMYPDPVVRKAQEAFEEDGKPVFSKRSGSRAIGLEGMGKFVTTPVHLLSGVTCFLYNLVNVTGFNRTEYMVLLHPGQSEPLRAMRQSTRKNTDRDDMPVYDWGKWQPVETLPDLKGCSSANPRTLTPGQSKWWLEAAQSYGLNPHKEVNNRSFQVLPLLKDLRVRL